MNNKICDKDKREKLPYSGCLFFAANALARSTSHLASIAYKSLGITAQSAYVLLIVVEMPGIHSTELAKKMMLTPSTITRLTDKLIKIGYLKKETQSKYCMLYPTDFALSIKPQLDECSNKLIQIYNEVFNIGKEGETNETKLCQITESTLNNALQIEEYLQNKIE